MGNLDRRLVLFDVDGTLLATDGSGRRAFERALRAVFGRVGPIEGYDFHGKTDPQIVYDLLAEEGGTADEIRARLPEFWPRYVAALIEELEVSRTRGGLRVLAGVRELLEGLARRPGTVLALLTGNVEAGARWKLKAVALDGIFAFGAYGSDSAVRTELPAIALQRAYARTGIRFAGREVAIVGDTPDDVACARAIGALGVAVATGRHRAGELREAGADVVLDDFRDVEWALRAICRDGIPFSERSFRPER
ncbi:MAG: haloacid dehalogenase-like hydrolase [Gemmatimonadetes bacterium]|nr:haloacid dehalogenase-like hydrolase [Gemmatimonadota bacterium]